MALGIGHGNDTPRTTTIAPGKPILVRNPDVSDAGALLCYHRFLNDEFPGKPTTIHPRGISLEEEVKQIEEFNRSPESLSLVAAVGGEVAGFLDFFADSHVGEFGVSVGQPYRGLGISRLLAQALVEWVRENRVAEKIAAFTHSSNQADLALNRRLGFETEAVLRREYLWPDGVYDDVIVEALWVK